VDDAQLMHPHRLVDSLEQRLRALETEFHRAWWDSQLDASDATDRRRSELELELRTAKGDPEAYAAVVAALEHDVHEPLLGRQLEVLKLSLGANQMSDEHRRTLVELATSIESDFATYRPQVGTERLSDNEIEGVLRTSEDQQERRRVWEASKEIGGLVADRVRELARVRNEVAHQLGYANYYVMALDFQELPEAWLFALLDEFDELTVKGFTAYKDELDERLKRRFSTEQLYPWHYADPFFQTMPPDGKLVLDDLFSGAFASDLVRRTFEDWGIDLSRVIEMSDLYPRDRKNQHAFCIDIDRTGNDVRILANVVPGEKWVEILLHECGHAAYDLGIDSHVPWLLHRASHTFTTEAIALLSGRLMRDPEWLKTVAQLDGSSRPPDEQLIATSARQALVFARWGLVVVHFERDLYTDPESDLNARWWELVERFQLVTPPPDRDAPDWAAKIHISSAPVYYQNYLLGDMLASQLRATCEREFGGLVGVRAAGELLVERVFKPGALLRWDSLVEEATGEALSARAFSEFVQPV
jgi:peptidyl-dipeptidase A